MSAPRARLLAAVEAAAHLLPAQGPIGVFVHHNTLHAFEHLPFDDALDRARDLLGAEAWLPLARYREEYASGRIDDHDLEVALDEGPAAVPRDVLRARMLLPLPRDAAPVVRWRIAETDALRRLRDDLPAATRARLRGDEARAAARLWEACRARVEAPPDPVDALLARVGRDRTHADLLRALTGYDAMALVAPALVPVCAAWLDLGQARWSMPEREGGLYRAWRRMTVDDPLPGAWWKRGLRDELRAATARDLDAVDAALESLAALDVAPEHYAPYVARVLLQLPGWAGMFHRLEARPEERARPDVPVSLVDHLALRLALERYAVRHLARASLGVEGAPRALLAAARARRQHASTDDVALETRWRLFHLAQACGRGLDAEGALDEADVAALRAGLERLDDATLRRLWHHAYERHHRDEVLTALAANARRPRAAREARDPRFQVAFCIDDREEGIRRHFEELSPRHETFGVAGFFGLAIRFQGVGRADAVSLCPVAVSPSHEVHEAHVEPASATARADRRALVARAGDAAREASSSLLAGAILTPTLGLAALPGALLRLLAPGLAARVDRRIEGALGDAPPTRLVAFEGDDGARRFGFDEAAERVRATLEGMGLTRGFARLVVMLGHGSESVNNPHRSAYDCGACGGRDGGPNARLFAAMANHPEVRARLRAAGVAVPEGTWFLGGLHNTATDAVTLDDLDAVPAALAGELAALRDAFERARRGSAHERCRRFASAPRALSPDEALRHVEARAVDLSQVRPELGHVTNAVCVVGRRSLTRGLFLDRRAFLVSYDPEGDPEGAVLERLLAAVGPVGAGINLEYYFSTVDNDRLGCGTKAPHNLVGLLGVMEGTHGDLRTGLPRQMIEIHEPVRLLFVVEAPPARVEGVVARRPEVAGLVRNGWVRVVCLDPRDGTLHAWGRVGFEALSLPPRALPTVTSSARWYAGRDGFVPPCIVEAPPAARATSPAARLEEARHVG